MTDLTREERAFNLSGEWALDIADGEQRPSVRGMCAIDFIEAIGVDDEDIANLICGDRYGDIKTRLQRNIEEKALAFFRDDRRGQQLIEDALTAEDEERAADAETDAEYARMKAERAA